VNVFYLPRSSFQFPTEMLTPAGTTAEVADALDAAG